MELPFDQINVLGDSLSDTGHFFNWDGNFPNEPFFAPARFSNGPVWLESFSADLGLKPVPFDPFDPDFTISADGINLAIGGAKTDDTNVSPIQIGLEQQVDYLTGLLEGQAPNPDALYVLWIGANDYLDIVLNSPENIEDTEQIVTEVVDNISEALQTLVDLGAETIVVPNLFELGKTPLGSSLDEDLTETLNDLSEDHNDLLEDEIETFSETYHDINFILPDIESLFDSFLEDPEDFGLTNVTQGATDTNVYDGTLDLSLLDPDALNEALERAETYLYWDNVHPTATTHELIKKFMLDEISDELKLTCREQLPLKLKFVKNLTETFYDLSEDHYDLPKDKKDHYDLLEHKIKIFSKSDPDIDFILPNIKSLFDSFFDDPEDFGLTNVTQSAINTNLDDGSLDLSLFHGLYR